MTYFLSILILLALSALVLSKEKISCTQAIMTFGSRNLTLVLAPHNIEKFFKPKQPVTLVATVGILYTVSRFFLALISSGILHSYLLTIILSRVIFLTCNFFLLLLRLFEGSLKVDPRIIQRGFFSLSSGNKVRGVMAALLQKNSAASPISTTSRTEKHSQHNSRISLPKESRAVSSRDSP